MCNYDTKVQALARAMGALGALKSAEEARDVAFGWWKPTLGVPPEEMRRAKEVLDRKVSRVLGFADANPGSALAACLDRIEAQPANRKRVLYSAVCEALRLRALGYLQTSPSMVSA